MKKTLTLVALFGLFLMVSLSCSKKDDEYILKVRVTVNDTTSVQNALVHVYAPVEPTFVDYYGYTDEVGETGEFEFGNRAVVEVSAGKGNFKGCGFADVVLGVTTITVNMKPLDDEENGCQTGS